MNPKVSIIVPVYNTAQYLPKCLDSLINQTFKDIEIICFNDASTDNSLEILKEYQNKDGRILIINSLVNVRQGGGRNRAIKASKGEYVMFVDSDDWVSHSFVELLLTTLIENKADICTAEETEVYQENNIKQISYIGYNLDIRNQDQIKRLVLKNGCRLLTSIIKKKLFTDNNLYFPENKFYEDNAIAAAIFLAAKKIIKIDRSVYFYRCDNISTTRSMDNPHFFDRLDTAIMMLENTKRIDINGRFTYEIEDAFIRLYYINTILGCVLNFRKVQSDKISNIHSTVLKFVSPQRLKEAINSQCFKIRIIIFMALHVPGMLEMAQKLRRLQKRLLLKLLSN